MKWTFKSPAYNLFGDSASGGAFGANLHWAGYDHIVVTGRARHPVYIWINDDVVEIRDAARLWGRDVEQADDLLKEELGDAEVETALIGRGAENLVTYASLTVSRHRGAGRTGAGCVFASKNLKAIAVRGTKGIELYDPQGFFAATDALIAALNQRVRLRDNWKTRGTLGAIHHYNRIAINAFRNNQRCLVPEEMEHKLSPAWYTANLATHALSCSPGCISGCSGTWRIKGNESAAAQRYAGEQGYKPEYGAVAAFGIMCDIADMPAVAHFFHLCRQYSIDALEVGACCSFLMELWQRGIINEKDTLEWLGEPLSLDWGNYQAVERIIHSIALQNNRMGELLKGGVYQAAKKIGELKGVSVLEYALFGKGGSAFIEDVRNTPSWATNFAVASRGCDHLKGLGTLDKVNRPDISLLYFGRPDGAEPFTTTLKGASSALAENRCAVINSLGLCVLLVASDPVLYPLELFSQLLLAVTGTEMSPEELLATGERTVNLEKAFNSRLGYRRQDDSLCPRWLNEPMPEGPGKGMKAADYLEQTKDEYYEWHGWDKRTSLQTRKKLEELDMLDVAQVLERENALV
jgi:aldehyde:ferredoxin oxidoreductase